jgi:hypothetical protein
MKGYETLKAHYKLTGNIYIYIFGVTFLFLFDVFQLPEDPPHPCAGWPGPLDEGSNTLLLGIYITLYSAMISM